MAPMIVRKIDVMNIRANRSPRPLERAMIVSLWKEIVHGPPGLYTKFFQGRGGRSIRLPAGL